MRLITDGDLPLKGGCVLSIGNFDGLHRGHRALIDALVSEGKRLGLPALVWTFEAHPQSFLAGKPFEYIVGSDDKEALFESAGVELLYSADFRAFRGLSAEAFVSEVICKRFGAKHVICGYNFCFGKDRVGNASLLGRLLEEQGVGLTVIEPIFVEGEAVSSTRLRELISNGEMETVQKLLGRYYSFVLPVLDGLKRGRKLGRPTLNQRFPKGRVVPAHGVYASFCTLEGKVFEAVTNIGLNPTFGDLESPVCETHLFDFEGDLYGKAVKVSLCKRLREEKKFSSEEALKEQIALDVKEARAFLDGSDRALL